MDVSEAMERLLNNLTRELSAAAGLKYRKGELLKVDAAEAATAARRKFGRAIHTEISEWRKRNKSKSPIECYERAVTIAARGLKHAVDATQPEEAQALMRIAAGEVLNFFSAVLRSVA